MAETEETRVSARALGLRDGVREALPAVLGYVPIGFAYGVVGTAAGIPLWAVVAMSVLVYAGSAQFIAVSLISQGASVAVLVVTTFLVNVRHLLYSLALSPRLERMSRRRLAWVAAELTDESFVMAARTSTSRDTRLSFSFMVGLNGVLQIVWIMSSAVGGVLGGFVGDPLALGLDYALIAMFIGLLTLQMRGSTGVIVAAVAGVVSLGLHLLGAGMLGIIVATVVAGGTGLVWAERR